MSKQDRAQRIIDWIHGARPMGKKAGLSNMHALMAQLGNPHKAFRSVHVAGTNGKGSTCAFLERSLRECGLKTGLYTSPYLCRYEERMRLDGAPIDADSLIRLGGRLMEVAESLLRQGIYPTAFELGTALAYCYFAEQRVDIAVIEVGLGGRMDSTNVITPLVSVIASIALDHTKILGETIAQIAYEKAGIVKDGVPLVLQTQTMDARAVIERVCLERSAPIYPAEDLALTDVSETSSGARFSLDGLSFEICLPGRHQIDNARLAIRALYALKEAGLPLNYEACRRGIAQARWPGRLEWLRPDLLLDGAHNLHGAIALSEYIARYFTGIRKVLLTGMMQDKQYEDCAKTLAPLFDAVVTTQVDWPKALGADALEATYTQYGARAEACPALPDAWARAVDLAAGDLIVVAGSLYLVGGIRSHLLGLPI